MLQFSKYNEKQKYFLCTSVRLKKEMTKEDAIKDTAHVLYANKIRSHL